MFEIKANITKIIINTGTIINSNNETNLTARIIIYYLYPLNII